jgi:hypothetical protein
MSYVNHIVQRLGGTRAAARLLGRPSSTVDSWVRRASIPDRHKPEIVEKAAGAGIALDPADFFPTGPTDQRGAA